MELLGMPANYSSNNPCNQILPPIPWKGVLIGKSDHNGIKVSSWVTLRLQSPYLEIAQDVLGAIDKVHSDGVLAELEIHGQPKELDNGTYFPEFHEIGLALDESQTPHLDTCHEVGHWLDHRGFHPESGKGNLGFRASESLPEMRDWAEAVSNSNAVQDLTRLLAADSDRYIEYNLRPRELWARSYAQYVAMRSSHPDLEKELDLVLNGEDPAERNQQWTRRDFAPIFEQIHAIFTLKRWHA